MIGMTLTHTISHITGMVDAEATDPAGNILVRIDDHWFDARDTEVV